MKMESRRRDKVSPTVSTATSFDRRRDPRSETNVSIRIASLDSQSMSIDAKCTDISAAGLGFDSDVVFRVGSMIKVEFPACDDKEPNLFSARVLFREGSHYGACFI